jgi:hypothetical protein
MGLQPQLQPGSNPNGFVRAQNPPPGTPLDPQAGVILFCQ